MAPAQPTRRDFLRAASAAVTGAAAVSLASAKKPAAKPKILNYNPKMGYRRLGKTELMISEVSLGGHGGRKWSDRVPVLEKAIELVKQKGARRVITLQVSIASHSPLMEPAAQGLRQALSDIALQEEAAFPVVGNVTGKPLGDVDDIRDELVRQLVSPVLWMDSVSYMLDHGMTTFVEIGPKDVLSKLVKRIDERPARVTVGDVAGIEAWHHEWGVEHEHATGG